MQATMANAGPIVVLSPDGVVPVKPSRIIYHFQEQADRAILASTSSAEAGRSDPGRQVDGTSDQRLSAVSADQPKGDIQSLPLSLPEWAPWLQIVPSQSVASLGVLQGADDRTPCESGPRRGPSVETSIPIQDRAVSGRIAIDARDLDRSRTSFGDPSESPEETLSRIVDDNFTFFQDRY